jgi:hypothetical protein
MSADMCSIRNLDLLTGSTCAVMHGNPLRVAMSLVLQAMLLLVSMRHNQT